MNASYNNEPLWYESEDICFRPFGPTSPCQVASVLDFWNYTAAKIRDDKNINLTVSFPFIIVSDGGRAGREGGREGETDGRMDSWMERQEDGGTILPPVLLAPLPSPPFPALATLCCLSPAPCCWTPLLQPHSCLCPLTLSPCC